jgi:hypothetical protein
MRSNETQESYRASTSSQSAERIPRPSHVACSLQNKQGKKIAGKQAKNMEKTADQHKIVNIFAANEDTGAWHVADLMTFSALTRARSSFF